VEHSLLLEETDDNNIGAVLEGVKVAGSGERSGGRSHPLRDPRDNGLLGAAAVVVTGLAIREPLEGGEALRHETKDHDTVSSSVQRRAPHLAPGQK